MGRQYYGISKSFNSKVYQVELHSSGGALDHLLTIAMPKFTWTGDVRRGYEDPINPSRCSCTFIMRDENDFGNFVNIGITEEQEWTMKVTKDGALFWVGRVLADQMTWKREARETGYAQITITAVDGLNLIEGYTVDTLNFSIGDRQTVINTICQILGKTGLNTFWGASDNFIQDGCQYSNTASVGGPLDGSIRDLSGVETIEPFADVLEWMDCKKFLQNILTSFGMRIMMSNGMYILHQLPAFDDSAYDVIYYDKDGGDLSTGAFTHRHSIHTTKVRPLYEAYPEQFFQEPVRKIEVNFTRRNGVMQLKSLYNTSTLVVTHDNIINGNTPGRPIQTSLSIKFYYDTDPLAYFDLRTEFYAYNPATGARYALFNGAWAIKSISVAKLRLYETDWKTGLIEKTWSEEMPEPPSGASEITMKAYLERTQITIHRPPGGNLTVWTSQSTTAWDFIGTALIRQAYNSVDPIIFEQPANYISDLDAPRDTNSKHPEIDVFYYNGKKYDTGSYMAWSGAGYVEAGDWSAPWTATTGDLPEMIADQWAGVYSDFLQVTRGRLRDDGNYMAHLSLFFDSTNYVFNGGDFDAYNDVWDGEWLGVVVNYTNVNNNGEGERVQNNNDRIEDKIKQQDEKIGDIRKYLSEVGPQLRNDIINSGTGAPTSDPGVSKEYNVMMEYLYDSAEPELNWLVREPSGVWTPTLANSANISASTAYECQYIRSGDIVFFSGTLDADPTNPSTETRVGISIPIASTFVAAEDCSGSAAASAVPGQSAGMRADMVAGNRIEMIWISADVGNRKMHFSGSYKII